MKKVFAWILLIPGGLLLLEGVLCAPAILFAEEESFLSRLLMSLFFIALAVAGFYLFRAGFRMKAGCAKALRSEATAPGKPAIPESKPTISEAKPASSRPAVPRKSPNDEEQANAVRAEIRAMYQDFLEGEGRLPCGFTAPYNWILSADIVYHGTPFDAYLRKIASEVDSINDKSGISDWLFMDETAGPDAAANLLAWANRHREMRKQLQEKCSIGNTTIIPPVSPYCVQRLMVVMDTDAPFRALPPEDVEKCKEAGISFCTHLTEQTLFDLTEQKSKWISYHTYPNYHDETYADWFFQ